MFWYTKGSVSASRSTSKLAQTRARSPQRSVEQGLSYRSIKTIMIIIMIIPIMIVALGTIAIVTPAIILIIKIIVIQCMNASKALVRALHPRRHSTMASPDIEIGLEVAVHEELAQRFLEVRAVDTESCCLLICLVLISLNSCLCMYECRYVCMYVCVRLCACTSVRPPVRPSIRLSSCPCIYSCFAQTPLIIPNMDHESAMFAQLHANCRPRSCA